MKKFAWTMICLASAIVGLPCAAQSYFESDYEWLKSKHHVRYLLKISDRYRDVMDVAQLVNWRADNDRRVSNREWQPIFDVNYPLRSEWPTENERATKRQERWATNILGFQLIEFRPDGLVKTANKTAMPLRIHDSMYRRNTRSPVLVAEPGLPGDFWYFVGTWFYGFPGDKGSEFEPAICDLNDESLRYSVPAFLKIKDPIAWVAKRGGKIGCREWAYQLKRPASLLGEGGSSPDINGRCKSGAEPGPRSDGRMTCPGLVQYEESDWQPYIDVTTRHGNNEPRIGEVLGWASFDHAVRPVIGQHGKHWICFHECPDGERPGVIENIGLWAARRGWPSPENHRVPFFPDSEVGPTAEDWDD
ncbi:hypothetical protein [Xylophilus sp. GOD-11R]|uniref:hypothetical protein n=1 Tax=Xylophilus sp. GOD-11R TaxID=3089814 RepID=UPI00298CDB1F|nr:hypothetical protein [Xylophilus sp. GOD-11R]WPB58843.1 hypothetical protein R9X41_09465 [Xylophilus sp. GOD-11R]